MNTDWSILWGEPGLQILAGLVLTLKLAAWALSMAVAIGLVVGVTRWLASPLLEPFCWLYIEFCRNTPPVVQILFWYFSASYILPQPLFLVLRDVGYEFGAAVVALALYHGAFFAEILRAGLNAIPDGQFQAARVLGLRFSQSMRRVILPQVVRITIPPLINEANALVKNTSLAMAIGVAEMTYQYKNIDNFLFRGLEALTAVTVIYLLLCLSIAGLGYLLDRRVSVHMRRPSAIRAGSDAL